MQNISFIENLIINLKIKIFHLIIKYHIIYFKLFKGVIPMGRPVC